MDGIYQANENDDGCAWLSVAGIVRGCAGNRWRHGDRDPGRELQPGAVSGAASRFGPAGSEFQVGTGPGAADYTLRLLGPAGNPVSDAVTVRTGDTCESNVAVIEFVQNHAY